MSVYGYVLYESISCVCLWLSDEPVLFCIYVWKIVVLLKCLDAPGKISCKLTESPSLNKLFELNWIEFHLLKVAGGDSGGGCYYMRSFNQSVNN